MCRKGVPEYAHCLIILLLGSQVKHDIIYTRRNKKVVEEWVQNVIRFYCSTKRRQKKQRAIFLQKHETDVRHIIEMVISFENILNPPPSKTTSKTTSKNGGRMTSSLDDLSLSKRASGDVSSKSGDTVPVQVKTDDVQKNQFYEMLTKVYDDIRPMLPAVQG